MHRAIAVAVPRASSQGMIDHVTIIRLGAFGDVLHTLPAVADLHAAGLRVRWVIEDRWAVLLRGSPVVQEIITWPRKTLRGGSWGARRQAWRRLRRHLAAQPGLLIDAHGLAKSAALGLGRHPLIGHAAPRAREGASLVYDARFPARATHVIDQQRALIGAALHRLGRPRPNLAGSPWRFPLPTWDREATTIAAWLADQQLTRPWVLNVGAGWPSKIWPVPQQAAWCQHVAKIGQRPLLLWGSPAERDLAVAVQAAAPAAVLAPATTIAEAGALLRQAAVLVSGDTGPLHLGFAVGCPSIGLFGPVPATRNGPRGAGSAVFQGPGVPWERRDPQRGGMAAIDPRAVAAASIRLARSR